MPDPPPLTIATLPLELMTSLPPMRRIVRKVFVPTVSLSLSCGQRRACRGCCNTCPTFKQPLESFLKRAPGGDEDRADAEANDTPQRALLGRSAGYISARVFRLRRGS